MANSKSAKRRGTKVSGPAPGKRSKRAANNGAERPAGTVASATDKARGYLIRIPDEDARKRAIVAFLGVPVPRCRFSDNRFLVTGAHIEALVDEGIPFDDITEPVEENG